MLLVSSCSLFLSLLSLPSSSSRKGEVVISITPKCTDPRTLKAFNFSSFSPFHHPDFHHHEASPTTFFTHLNQFPAFTSVHSIIKQSVVIVQGRTSWMKQNNNTKEVYSRKTICLFLRTYTHTHIHTHTHTHTHTPHTLTHSHTHKHAHTRNTRTQTPFFFFKKKNWVVNFLNFCIVFGRKEQMAGV